MISLQERILAHLGLYPGSRASEIAGRLSLSRMQVSVALSRLGKRGRVVARRIPRLQRRAWEHGWWVAGDKRPRLEMFEQPSTPSARRAACLDPQDQALFAVLEAEPGLSGKLLQPRLGLKRRTQDRRLRTLLKEGLISRDGPANLGYTWRLTPDLEP